MIHKIMSLKEMFQIIEIQEGLLKFGWMNIKDIIMQLFHMPEIHHMESTFYFCILHSDFE